MAQVHKFTLAAAVFRGQLPGMTLSEIIPDVRNLTAADKLRLIRILANEVDPEPEIGPLQHGRTYTLATPPFEPGAAEVLMHELQTARQD